MSVVVTSKDERRHLEVVTRDVAVSIDRFATEGEPSDGFHATELLLGALGACMVGTALEFARRQEMPLDRISMALDGETLRHPERIGKIVATMTVDGDLSDKQLERLARVASRCKVHNTLTADGELEISLTVDSSFKT